QQIRRIHQLDTTYRPFHSEQRIDFYSLNGVSVLPNNTAYSVEELLKELRSNSYSGRVEEYVVGHITNILEILNPIEVDGMDPFQLRMMTFPLSLSGKARKWWMNEGDGKINTWEELRNSKFKDHKKVDETTKRGYSWIEVGNDEGLIDEDISSNDDRDQTYSSIITKPEIKIGDEFLKILHDNSFNGMDGSDITDHIAKVLKITKWIKIPNVDKDELRLHVLSKSLSGDARKWWNSEGTITTWKELSKKISINITHCPIPTKVRFQMT
ncbi:hypothetical protein Tco_1342995, partial [Tanacetum coccineum]